jgi:T5SS/PEP-CTERM-associated repeat protein
MATTGEGTSSQKFSYLTTSGFIKGSGNARIGLAGTVVNATKTNADFFQGFSTNELTIHDLVFNTGTSDIGFSTVINSTGFLNKTGAGSLHLAQGGSWTNNLIVSQGLLHVSGNTTAAWLLVGDTPKDGTSTPGTSTLLIDNGKTTVGTVYVGNSANYSGKIIVTGAGTTLEQGGLEFHIGNNASSSLEVLNGATVSATALRLGFAAGGTMTVTDSYLSTTSASLGFHEGVTGQATISGMASGKSETWRNSGELRIGDGGTGILTISNEATVVNTGATIVGYAGKGTITVTNSYLSTMGTEVGFYGNGTIELSGISTSHTETWLNNGALTLGNVGTGLLTVANNAKVVVTGFSYIGAANTGTINASSGSTVASQGGAALGYHANSKGFVIIDDAAWEIIGGLSIGAAGTGTMNVSGKSHVKTSGAAELGASATGNGSATIDDSLWEITGNLAVGGGGTGTLVITNGGVVNSGNDSSWNYIGYADYSATGSSVTIGGANSQGQKATWNLPGNLVVGGIEKDGNIGTGTLTINNDGVLSAGALILGGEGKGNLYLNSGGTIETGSLRTDSPAGYAQANFNGGTIRATQGDTGSPFFYKFSGDQLNIGGHGLTIETDYDISTDSTSGFSGTGGITKTRKGNFTINASTTYTGSTDIYDGGMWFNGAQNKTSTVSVGYGSVLGGIGSIDGTIYAKGTIAPGSARGKIGTLTVKGNVSLATTSVLELVVGSADAGGYSSLDLGGTGKLSIDSGAQLVLKDLGYVPGINDSFDIVTGLISPAIGSFTYEGQVIGSGDILSFAGQNFQAIYSANSISLVAIPEPSTYALWGGGILCSLMAISRRRRTKTA